MKKVTLIVLDEKGAVPRHSWEYWAADMIIQQTSVPDTYKIVKSKYTSAKGHVRLMLGG